MPIADNIVHPFLFASPSDQGPPRGMILIDRSFIDGTQGTTVNAFLDKNQIARRQNGLFVRQVVLKDPHRCGVNPVVNLLQGCIKVVQIHCQSHVRQGGINHAQRHFFVLPCFEINFG
eukprot:scaffold8752_cov160-Amphora_coffeaeformis.AAC.1